MNHHVDGYSYSVTVLYHCNKPVNRSNGIKVPIDLSPYLKSMGVGLVFGSRLVVKSINSSLKSTKFCYISLQCDFLLGFANRLMSLTRLLKEKAVPHKKQVPVVGV
jgi:hypothetical protein